MERILPMNEVQIQEKVEYLAGKPIRILDCEQNTLNQTQEVFLVNGLPVSLTGEEGLKIKQALIQGEVLSCDLVNCMLIRAGIENNPVELETTVDVKSSVKTREQSQMINANGILLGENKNQNEDADHVKRFSLGMWITDTSKSTSDTEHEPGPDYIQWKPEDENATSKPSTSVPTKSMKSHSSTAEPSGQEGGGHKSPSESVTTKSKGPVPGQLSDNLPGEEPPTCNKVDNLWDSLKSQKTKNIFTFFLNRKFNEWKKSPGNPGHLEVGNGDESTKAKLVSKTGSTPDDKHKKKKKQHSSEMSSVAEPKYDSIVQSSAAIMSDHAFKKTAKSHDTILDPTSSLVGVEVDAIPARVTYETFV